MMPQQSLPFIAELHDIGKLVDKNALQQCSIKIKGHTFHDFDFSQNNFKQPTSPSWYIQYSETDQLKKPIVDLLNAQEAQNKINDPKIRADILLTKIADGIASSISRLELYGKHIQKGQVSEGVYKLWNPLYYTNQKNDGLHWSPFKDINELENMFNFIDTCNDYQRFMNTYSNNLKLTPEDKTSPGNIVSLYTHLELVGKIYRVLNKHSKLVSKNGDYSLEYNKEKIKTVQEASGKIDLSGASGKWRFRLISCHIEFSQSFSRLQDLNIFKKRSGLINHFSQDEATKDYVLFFTDDFFSLFVPIETELKLQELLKPFLESNLIVNCMEMDAELNLLTSSMDVAYHKSHSVQYSRYLKLYDKCLNPDMPKNIYPPLCDLCQIRPGKERIKDQIHEYICDDCQKIRDMGEPFQGYADWKEEGVKAAWFKITLDHEKLLHSVQNLFNKYVDNHPSMNSISTSNRSVLKNSFRPLAVQMDFIKDYKLFLNSFNQQIYQINFNGKNLFSKEGFVFPIDNYLEFGIVKYRSGKDIIMIIDLFKKLLSEYFPECKNQSPINISVSVAPVKYPYQEHWRYLSKPVNTINIRNVGSLKLEISTYQYDLMRNNIRLDLNRLSHFLHHLSDIESKTDSDMSVMLEIYKNRKKFPALLELTQKGLSINHILDFFKLSQEVDAS